MQLDIFIACCELSEVSVAPAQLLQLFSYLRVGMNWEGLVRLMAAGTKRLEQKAQPDPSYPLPPAYTDLKN